MSRSDPLESIAKAILDGSAVDWNGVEARAEPDSRPAIQQLRLLEQFAQFHRGEGPVKWAHLEVLGILGRGAFGTVYRAWDPSLEREVALKLLASPPPAADDGPGMIEEGRMLARVRHPNVVTIHGAARSGGQVGLWMELVRGETLGQLLQRGRRFTAEETIRIGLELCDAVSAVHAAGLLHRDIKAQNVVKAENGRVVLMDLGAAEGLADALARDVAGTPLYLAPEVLHGGKASVRSDIYALGVLLYHLLTNSYPVSGSSIVELEAAHAADVRVSLRRERLDVPAALSKVIDRAIDAAPARRYASVAEMAEALGAAQRRGSRHSLAALATAAAVVAAVAMVAVSDDSPRGPRVAVLAFDSAGGEPMLASGLTQEIQRSLAGLDRLVLLASPPPGRAAGDPISEGRALGADFVVAGATFRAGEMLRVNARLVRVDDAHLAWSETYDRPVEGVFTITEDISQAIADALRVKLRLPRRYDLGLDVYYQFVRGKEIQSHRSADHLRDAAGVFEEVVARAPAYAPAWAAIASSLIGEAWLRDVPPPPRGKDAAETASRLDEFQAEAQQAMGNLFAADGRWRDADDAFLRALDIDPSLTFTYTEFVLASLLPQRRLSEALRYLDEAERRDSRSLDVRRVKALVLVEAGRYAEALQTVEWVLARDRQYPFANLWKGRALALSGQPNEALAYYGQEPGTEAYRGYALAVLGRRADAEELARSLKAEPHRQMLIYGGLNDVERAFAALDRVVAQNRWRAATWMIRPEVAMLRDDPRYGVVRDRLNLPPEPTKWRWNLLRQLHLFDQSPSTIRR